MLKTKLKVTNNHLTMVIIAPLLGELFFGEKMKHTEKNIVFYDDDCGLCDRFVKILINMEIKNLYFAPLHKETYNNLLGPRYDSYDSVIFYKSGTIYLKSQAVIEILGLKSPLFLCLKIIPKFISDIVYSFVAKNRKRLFPLNSCLVPSESVRDRFLD